MSQNVRWKTWMAAVAACVATVAGAAFAEQPQPIPVADPSSVENIRAALFGGVPGDRWKEGLLFEGIR